MTTCTTAQAQPNDVIVAAANDQTLSGIENPKITLSEESLAAFFNLFQGRIDKVGLATSLSTDRHSEATILTDVRNHLSGKCRLGFYNLLQDGTCTWAMIEFEDHGHGALADPRGKSLEAIDHVLTPYLGFRSEVEFVP